MKYAKIIYWITTVMLCGIMLFSAIMYFTKYEMVKGFFEHLGHPTYIIYPLAVLKILGVIAILSRKVDWLKEWAYAGFFFDMALATAAHHFAGDGLGLSVIGIVLLIISYSLEKRVFQTAQ